MARLRSVLVILAVAVALVVSTYAAPASAYLKPAERPTITGMSTHVGSYRGGERITIYGRHLRRTAYVHFGSDASSYATHLRKLSDRRITVVAPAAYYQAHGVHVRLEDDGGTASPTTPADNFLFVYPPTVSSVTSPYLPTHGGRWITVTGTGFRSVRVVRFGLTPAVRVHVLSPTRLTALAPAQRAGAMQLFVRTVYGLNESSGQVPRLGRHNSPNAIFYFAPPTITTTSLPPMTAGIGYRAYLGGSGPGSSFSAVSLPPGLELDGSYLDGRLPSAGTYDVTLELSDLARQSTRHTFTLTVDPDHWRASPFPLPDDANPASGAGIADMDCPTSDFCAATGAYSSSRDDYDHGLLAVRSNGVWQVVGESSPEGRGGIVVSKASSPNLGQTRSISCPVAGFCAAIGRSEVPGELERGVVAVLRDGSWTVQEPPLPQYATWTAFRSVSCWAVDECAVVGYSNRGAVIEVLHGQEWSAVSDVDSFGAGGNLLDIECDSAGTCTAAGYASGAPALIASNRTGQWQAETLATPADAARGADFSSISCPTQTTCTAVGTYGASESPSARHALVESNVGGSWQLRALPSVVLGLDGVSCTSADDCLARGELDDDYSGAAVVETAGIWSAPTPVPSSRVFDVDCAAAAFCVAGGDAFDPSRQVSPGWIETISNGVASRQPASPPVGAGAAPAGGGDGAMQAVSCADPQTCVAVVGYNQGGRYLPLVEDYVPAPTSD